MVAAQNTTIIDEMQAMVAAQSTTIDKMQGEIKQLQAMVAAQSETIAGMQETLDTLWWWYGWYAEEKTR